MKKKILFITGSLNQTTQMHQISECLEEYDCWFSQLFTDNFFMNALINYTPLLNRTVLSGQFKKTSEGYLTAHGLNMDYKAQKNDYDLVVYCTDLLIPRRMRRNKLIWVQEGMTDRFTLLSRLIRFLRLPPMLSGGTSLNGTTNICDVYCVASEGYKEQLSAWGTDRGRIVVTGIPNYDDVTQFLTNGFPHHNYVMVATSDLRETLRFEDRLAFISKATQIADGRPLLFKLHPNENIGRAEAEIRRYAPAGTMIYASGNTNEMIANCCELITQYSTVVYVGMALGKKVHSYFDLEALKKLAPMQNGGKSASIIAALCRQYLHEVEQAIDERRRLRVSYVGPHVPDQLPNYQEAMVN